MDDVIKTPWSYSKISAWKQCAYKAALRYIYKHKEPKGPALIRGTEAHAAIEAWVKGKLRRMPEPAESHASEITKIKQEGGVSEQGWFIDRYGRLVCVASEKEEAPPQNKYWLEVWIDAHVWYPTKKLLRIWDFKTGRVRNYDDQKEIYALAGFARYDAEKIEVINLFLDQNDRSEMLYHRDRKKDILNKWRAEVKAMTTDKKLEPNPGPLCKWCGYSRFKGGPCRFAEES